jgi:hypothetical protein
VLPEGISNRARDNWAVLKAIADVAGGEWPDYIDAAAKAAQSTEVDDASRLELLLTDIKAVAFPKADENSDVEVRSADLVQHLIELEGRPWAEMGHARKPLTQNRLARMLKDVGVAPTDIGPERARVRGYKYSQFQDVFDRYLVQEGV